MGPFHTPTLVWTPWAVDPALFVSIFFVFPALVWIACAWWHVWWSDPYRERRSAVRELRRLTKKLVSGASPPQARELHAWLQITARAWGIRCSAPTTRDLVTVQSAAAVDPQLQAQWINLWNAAEHSLYGDKTPLPHDWLRSSHAAASTLTVPSQVRAWPNEYRDWWPAALTVVALMSIFPPGWSQAAAPTEMAAKSLRELELSAADALSRGWSNPQAHQIIATARLEREDWGVALAHATAAFAQAPDASAHATLMRALEQNEPAARELRPLMVSKGLGALPRQLSPATWQRVALGAACLAAMMLALLVLSLYLRHPVLRDSRRRHRLQWLVGGVAAFCLLAFGASANSWRAWGALANPQAAVVLRSTNLLPIPTDLLPEEETAPLLGGTVIAIEGRFLGWRKIATGEGNSGWVRRQALRPLYLKPD